MKFSREAVFNALVRMMEAIPSWIPFASAMALCYIVSSGFGPGMRSWEPAFYSFLPMCFFFVGVNLHMMGRELRSLREKVARLEETHDRGDGGVLRSMPGEPADSGRGDGGTVMRGLFADPMRRMYFIIRGVRAPR